MAITVVIDEVQGHKGSITRDGLLITRTGTITGVTGSSPEQKVWNALNASGVPKRYDAYPGGLNIACDSVEVTALSPGQFKFVATYKLISIDFQAPSATAPCKVTIGTTLQQVLTNKDKDGNLITIPYTAPGDTVLQQIPCDPIEIQIPMTVYTFSRREPSVPNVGSLVGCVNNNSFFGCAARTLLFSRCNVAWSSDQSGYELSYEFQYKTTTWDVEVFYFDPATGKLADGVTISPPNGYAKPQLLQLADFASMSLY